MITDTEFNAWLIRDNVRRVVLVEAQAHDGSGVVTRYFSNTPYASFPTDTPANQPYDDLLKDVPRFSNVMAEAFEGNSRPAIGEMVVDNSNGERDDWLLDSWAGYPVKLYLGDPSWIRDDYRLILDGITADIQAKNKDSITFKIRDKQDLLNKQVQPTLYTTGSAIGKPKPLCYGEVFQITPVLVDSATHKYQIHDGVIQQIVAVYIDGVSTAFTNDLSNGGFTMASAITGQITVDAKGAKPSGTYIVKVADIVLDIATRAGLVSGDIDSASLTAMNTTCPQTIGLYIPDRQNIMSVFDVLLKSVGGFYGFGRDGKLKLGRLNAPVGTATLSLTADDIEANGLDVKTISPPIKTVRLGYKRYYSPMTAGVASGVTEAVRADLMQEYRAVTASNSVPEWPLAAEPDLIPTALALSAEAQTECTRRATLYSVPRRILKIRSFTASQQIELGQEIKITWPRYGLDSGEYAIVVGINESPTSFKVDLEVWL